MSNYNISGIQQVGVGVSDVKAAFDWYRKKFGFDIPVVDAPGTAELMLPYTGGKPQERHAIIALNIQGGGGLEIWQYLSRTPKAPDFQIKAGDLGVYITKLKSPNIEALYLKFKNEGDKLLSSLETAPHGIPHFYMQDPYGNIFEIMSEKTVFKKTEMLIGGVFGACVGVTDIEKSKKFYADILGYDKVLFEQTGHFADTEGLPRGGATFTRVILTHTQTRKGAFSKLFGNSQIELWKLHNDQPQKIYQNRYWGDLGFIQICMDVQNMAALKAHCQTNGHPFTVDSLPEIYTNPNAQFDMGEASGHFTYIEDPDGTLIEFVEAFKIPLVKKLGWYLNLKNRNPLKALPDWMLKTMAWNRVKG